MRGNACDIIVRGGYPVTSRDRGRGMPRPYIGACMSRFAVAVIVLVAMVTPVRADDWPQWLGPKRDGVWREQGTIDRFPEGGAKVRWKAPVGGGFAGPAVAAGRVFEIGRAHV